ncbi:hypothetical protein DRW41_00550 [Neobacillus piezotolerans]|uniref:Uncharacterized protein n=1 Tax=Neobacillus piezotolerans TaxID=2259171 RepID=A0A3D8GV56_9BACI|nr:hypothetical protein [Neobacillus piezotolerans]RDU38099.1 hypothetical protein DRW41_00550 [Neobacillus piezotolerans]
MKKKLAIILGLIYILIGCSSDEERVVNKLKSEVEGKYSIVIFDNKTTSEEYQGSINNDLIDANELREVIHSLTYIILDENSSHDYNYKKALSLNSFPEIVVFDNKGIVLQTNKVEELEKFFLQ